MYYDKFIRMKAFLQSAILVLYKVVTVENKTSVSYARVHKNAHFGPIDRIIFFYSIN